MIEVVQNADGTWRVKNVPIIGTGIEYPLMTGPTTFSEEQLADAVAALEDPAIAAPRIKLGHTSGYNEALVGDAEQAFGRIDPETMRLGDNGQTIYGDYTGLPEWLATVMGMAYPNRSIEGNFDTETVTGRHYKLVINAVSLLGVYWPGCQVLEDLPTWYGSAIPSGVEFSAEMEAELAASGGNVPQIKADADTSRVRRQFYDAAMNGSLAAPEGTNTYWWWIRGERVADDGGIYLIAEDDESGDLFKVPVSVSGDEVTFGDPAAVTIEYPEKTAAARAAVVAGMRIADDKIRVHASRADTGGPEPSTQKGASRMDDAKRKALVARLGLPEGATEEQINAKLQEQALAGNPRSGAEGGEPDNAGQRGDEVTPEQQPPAHQTPPGTAPTGTGSGLSEEQIREENERAARNQEGGVQDPEPDAEATVRVDKKLWEETQQGAALARKHESERVAQARSAIIDEAIKAGKFAPSRREHYTKLLASDFDGGKALIESLATGMVPVTERGSSGAGEDGTTLAGQGEGLPEEWFPEIAQRRAAVAKMAPVTQAKEG